MKTFIVAAALAAAFAHAAPVAAQVPFAYSWCAQEQNGATNCTFETFQQCLETVSGVGGICSPNSAARMLRGQEAYAQDVRAQRDFATGKSPQAGSVAQDAVLDHAKGAVPN